MGHLLSNAFKFTRDRTAGLIEVGSHQEGDENIYLVRDNGAGFQAEYASKLFGVFQRLHGSEFEGIGMGLATVQQIAHRHGGRAWAEGEAGRGATFYLALPGGGAAD
jgi:light-regulated signal transduction histidine kinase (bacteriophytochrome)